MNRETRFRAWDNSIKEMIRVSSIDFDQKYIRGLVEVGNNIDMESSYILDKVELMQYTGLKDCDGVEIYEGDIFTDEDNKTHVVTFKNGGFGSAGRFLINYYTEESIITHEPLSNSVIDGCKVIGNIHENPELLK